MRHHYKAVRSIAISSCASKGEIRVDFLVQSLYCVGRTWITIVTE